MDSLQPQLDDLSTNIDHLESALHPLLTAPLTKTTSTLPLLDKAKLLILTTYALESILFSFIRLNGIDAKAHPVFRELHRVKGHFAKIKAAEDIGAGEKSGGAGRLDREAAGRFIRAALAGNERYDRDREERMGRERAGAKRKLDGLNAVGTHTRFDAAAKRIRRDEGAEVNVVKASEVDSEEEDEEEEGEEDDMSEDGGDVARVSPDQVAPRTHNRERKKTDNGPVSGKKRVKAANVMHDEDPGNGIPDVAKYDAKGGGSTGRQKKKKKSEKSKA